MELAALEVPIRVTGAGIVQGTLQAVERAGTRANAVLVDGAQRTGARVQASYNAMGRAYLRAMQEGTTRGRATMEQQGAALAQSLTIGLERQLARQQAEIKEELARGLLTPEEAKAKGQAAAQAYNEGVLDVISQQGAQGAFSGAKGGQLFVGLTEKLRNVEEGGIQGARGIRTLSSGLANLAASELGVRSGLGTMAAVLGNFALGATLTLGVTAGLAAIAYGYHRLEQAAEAARQRVKESQAALATAMDERRSQLATTDPLAAANIAANDARAAQQRAINDLATAEAKLAAARYAERVAEAAGITGGLASMLMHEQVTNALNNRTAAANNLAAATNKQIVADTEAARVAREARTSALVGLVGQGLGGADVQRQALLEAEQYRQKAIVSIATNDLPAANEAWQRHAEIISAVGTRFAAASEAALALGRAYRELSDNTRLVVALTEQGRKAFEDLKVAQEDDLSVTGAAADMWIRYTATLSESILKHTSYEDALARGNAKAREFQDTASRLVASRRAVTEALARDDAVSRLGSMEREALIASAEASNRLEDAQRLQHEARMAQLTRELDQLTGLLPVERQRAIDAAEAVFTAQQQGQRAAALIQLRNDETSAAAAAADAAGRWGDAEQLRYQAQVAALQDELARTVGLTDAEKQRRLQALADIETARQLGQIRQTAYTIEDAAFAVVLRRMRIQGQADDAERLAATRRIDLMIAELKARKAITEEQEKQLRLLLGISTAPLTDMEQTLQSLAEQAKRMGSLSSILDQLSAAWLTFWQAIGSGEGVEGGLKKVLQGMAQYLARWAMTQALLNIAKGIGGDPKGFAAAAAYMAAAAALAAFAGSMGGSGGGGGGGGNRYDATVRDREVITQTGPRLPRQPGYNPRLQPAGVSATAATAAQLRPPAPVVVNQTIIGERDPIAQRQIAAMTATAARRGYATTGGR